MNHHTTADIFGLQSAQGFHNTEHRPFWGSDESVFSITDAKPKAPHDSSQ
jgi:hypothetical protein